VAAGVGLFCCSACLEQVGVYVHGGFSADEELGLEWNLEDTVVLCLKRSLIR
jgi:hypothetical protein